MASIANEVYSGNYHYLLYKHNKILIIQNFVDFIFKG